MNQLSTLGHPQRMAVFRLLVRRCPDALPAGEIARVLGLKPSTASVYLSALTQTGLIKQTRHGTSLRYNLDLTAAQGMVSDLFLDCCRGRPDLCPPMLPSAPDKSDKTLSVLFLCTGNSARSIFAEAILKHVAGDRFAAHSAGTKPNSELNPAAIEMLESEGIDTFGLRPKNIREFQGDNAPTFDFVFTVCDLAANEECPPWRGQSMTSHWGLPDPVEAQGEGMEKQAAFQCTYSAIFNRISAFTALPFDALDRATMQQHIDHIGQTEHAT